VGERRQPKGDIARVIAASFAAISSARGGGASGALSGIGGLLGTLSTLGSVGAAAGPLGIAGAVVGGLGLLGSLFTHSQPAVVMIDGYSSTALSQQEQLMVALSGFRDVNLDIISPSAGVDDAMYAIGRRSRLDAVSRLPPGTR